MTGEDFGLSLWKEDRYGLCVGGRSNGYLVSRVWTVAEAGKILICFHPLGYTRTGDLYLEVVVIS